jgi:O-methyltransferase
MSPERLYLNLLKQCLTRSRFGSPYRPVNPHGSLQSVFTRRIVRFLSSRGLVLCRPVPMDPEVRSRGGDWPLDAETMVGLKRLDNLETCITDVLRRGIPGDLIETGVWRGGSVIFMRAVLAAYGDLDRRVWVADSFQGLPPPDPETYPVDRGMDWSAIGYLAVSLDDVKKNFERYGLLDDRVCFLPGWFRDTLPRAPIEQLSILRLDGDLYESTMVALRALYPKLSPGGYVIVDDYAIDNCRRAVEDFREAEGIRTPIQKIDWTGVFWQRD